MLSKWMSSAWPLLRLSGKLTAFSLFGMRKVTRLQNLSSYLIDSLGYSSKWYPSPSLLQVFSSNAGARKMTFSMEVGAHQSIIIRHFPTGTSEQVLEVL
jgi:hypothetical protein